RELGHIAGLRPVRGHRPARLTRDILVKHWSSRREGRPRTVAKRDAPLSAWLTQMATSSERWRRVSATSHLTAVLPPRRSPRGSSPLDWAGQGSNLRPWD